MALLELRYGGWAFPITPKITVSESPVYSHEAPEAYRETWQLEDDLFGTAYAGASGIRDLRQAIEQNVIDAAPADLRLLDGSTVIKALWGSRSISGVTIADVGWPAGDGAEYATVLPFRMTLHADFVRGHNHPVGDSPALPSAKIYGEYTISETIEENARTIRIGGTYVSDDRTAAIDAVKAVIDNFASTYILLSRRITEKYGAIPGDTARRKNSVQFETSYIDRTKSPEVYDFSETISVGRGLNSTPIVRPMLGGFLPAIQVGPATHSTIRQSGSAKGRVAYPDFPPLLSLPLVRNQEDKQSPKLKTGGGYHEYGITWSREYIAVGEFILDDPTNPPQPAESPI